MTHRLLQPFLVAIVAAIGLATVVVAQPKPDETETAIRAAQKAYRAGQLIDARQLLDKASDSISQAAVKKLESFFPDSMDGWVLEGQEDAATPSLTVSRTYSKGSHRITISISGDVRVLAEMAFMVLDAGQAKETGARVVKVKGNAGVITSDGQIQVLVANRFLVIAEGDAPEDAKNMFLDRIDFRALSKL